MEVPGAGACVPEFMPQKPGAWCPLKSAQSGGAMVVAMTATAARTVFLNITTCVRADSGALRAVMNIVIKPGGIQRLAYCMFFPFRYIGAGQLCLPAQPPSSAFLGRPEIHSTYFHSSFNSAGRPHIRHNETVVDDGLHDSVETVEA